MRGGGQGGNGANHSLHRRFPDESEDAGQPAISLEDTPRMLLGWVQSFQFGSEARDQQFPFVFGPHDLRQRVSYPRWQMIR
jgi:hypothetical protein